MYKPTRQSNAIGLGFLGFGILFATTVIYKWKIGPHLREKRRKEAEEWAEFVFEQEQNEKQQKA